MIIGIDLGTTNSLVSVWKDEKVTLIPNSFGESLTPSVVSFDADGTVYVGKTAVERLVTCPDVTFKEFKRDMGTDKTFSAYGRKYRPEDLSALVLKQLKEDAQNFLGEPVTEAVISVPAYFNDSQRAATRNAGLIAGLKVERLINEPSAAALAHHIDNIEDDELFIVFDFGGGTLDVSLVDAFDNIIEIQVVSGDNKLGGKDFNSIIAYDICKSNNIVWEKLGAKEQAILYREAENIKKQLSGSNEISATIRLDGREYGYVLDNQKLIDLSSELFRRITVVLQRLMNDAQVGTEDIAGVIMVGGSSRMPVVRHYVASLFGKKLYSDSNPDEIVCIGAGVVGGIKERKAEVRDIVISDICPFTLGIGIIDDTLSPIIAKNQVLPCSHVQRYVTVENKQKKLNFSIYQGENNVASKNLLIEKIELSVPPKPAGEVYADVRFSYDINGIFDVDINCPVAGTQIHKELGTGGGLSEAELARRKAEMDKIKIHPRDIEQNKYALERADRLYAECNEAQRELVAIAIKEFKEALDTQNMNIVKKAYVKFEMQLAMIERTLFHFSDFDADMWKETLGDSFGNASSDGDASFGNGENGGWKDDGEDN